MKVRVEVSGSVVFSELGSQPFPIGTPMSGHFEYFTMGTDLEPLSPFLGVYQDALTEFGLTFGSYTATSPTGEIEVEHSVPFIDKVTVNIDPSFGLAGPALILNGPLLFGEFFVSAANIFFHDADAMTLSSKDLPPPTEVQGFPLSNSFVSLTFRNAPMTSGGFVSASIDTVSATLVPVPPAIVLMAIPLVYLGRSTSVAQVSRRASNRFGTREALKTLA